MRSPRFLSSLPILTQAAGRASRLPFGVSALLVLLGVGWVLSDRLNADGA